MPVLLPIPGGPLLSSVSLSPIGLVVAFAAGMLSFLSPCVLPLVPGYLSMVSGLSASELAARRVPAVATRGPGADGGGVVPDPSGAGAGTVRTARLGLPDRRLVQGSLTFVAGFTVVFTALGAAASGLGSLLEAHRAAFDIAAGTIVTVFGLLLAGLGGSLRLPRERRFHPLPSRMGRWGPPVLGMAFAFGWTPCIGPVLTGVLSLAAARATLASGVALLVVYSLGLGVPFVLTGLAWGRATGILALVRSRLRLVDIVSGLALAAFGLLLLTGELHRISSLATALLDGLGLGRLTTS